MEQKSSNILFQEVQKARQWWIWLIVLGIGLSSWYSYIRQIIFDSMDEGAASNYLVWGIWILFGLLLPVLFITMKLEVKVTDKGIDIRFFPFLRRTFFPGEIKAAYARKYHPLREYGGWGVRWSPKYGMAYNLSGNKGVQFEFVAGKKLLIGSQKPDEFAAAVTQMRAGANSELGC